MKWLARKGDSTASSKGRSSLSDGSEMGGGSARLSLAKVLELERRVDNREREVERLSRKLEKVEKEALQMRVGFLKQMQHLKEMAHRNETLPNYTFLEVQFFSAGDGFSEEMLFLVNKRLEEARD